MDEYGGPAADNPEGVHMARKLATRHRCTYGVSFQCVKGSGKGPAKCPTCKGSVVRTTGLYGVFTWTGDNRYPEANAHSLHTTERAADKATEADERYVVRWVLLDA